MAKLVIPRERRQYHSVYSPDRGLKKDLPSTMIDERYTPSCNNTTFRDGILSSSYGSTYFANTDTSPLPGSVMGFDQYYKTDGTEKLICFTTRHIFSYNATTQTFECITPSTLLSDCESAWTANTNVTVSNDSSDKRRGSKSVKVVIDGAFGTGVAAYIDISSTDASGNTHLYLWIKSSINTSAGDLKVRVSEQTAGGTGADYEDVDIPALSAGVWTMVSVEFSGASTKRDAVLSVSLVVSTDNGAQTVWLDDIRAVTEFTGDEDDFFTSEIFNDTFVFSNGVDGIYKWDTSDDSASVLSGTSGWSCKKMLKFGERLCLYHTIESGTRYPQRCRWSVAGDMTDWTGSGSGYSDLVGVLGVDWIQTVEKIGNYVAMYAERTIVLQEYKGDVSEPFAFSTRVSGVGVAAPRCVINLGDEHLFLGWDGFYTYSGGRTVDGIDDGVREYFLSIINPQYVNRSFAVYIEEHDECKFYVPTGTATTPDAVLTYSLKNSGWSKGSADYTGFGYYELKESLTIDDMADSIDSYSWLRFDDSKVLALAPITLLGDGSGGVLQYNESSWDEKGSAVDSYFETKDFVQGERYRGTGTYWCQLEFEGRGDSVTLYYSTDGGESWSGGEEFTLSDSWEMYRWDIEVYSEKIRFRFRNNKSGEGFEVRQFEVGYVPSSDRGF